MKYSVVIPLYNKEHYIASTLRSVLAQTYPDYEVIVVDDGSTDNSLQTCKTVQSDKIQIVQQANQGVSAARNKGIELAAGEYICFLDADDAWHPDYLQNIETIVQKYPQSANICKWPLQGIAHNATGGWLPDKLLGNAG